MQRYLLLPPVLLCASMAQAQRPTEATLKALGPAAVKLTNIRYTTDTTGQADITLDILGKTGNPIKNASFTGLTLSGMDIQKLNLVVPAEARYEGLGGVLVIAKDSVLAYDATNGADPCKITGAGRLELPFTSARNNQKIALGVPILKFVTQPSMSVKIEGANVINLADQNDGIDLGGIALKAPSGIDATLTNVPGSPKWEVSIKQTRLEMELPGSFSDDGTPLTFTVSNLKLSSEGDPTFTGAALDPSSIKKIPLLGQAGFELNVKNAALDMNVGSITSFQLGGDLALPQGITNAQGNRVTLPNLSIDAKTGLVLAYTAPANQPLDLRWQGMALKTTGLLLDFSATAKLPNATGVAAAEPWMGAGIPQATLELPAALGNGPNKPSTISTNGLYIDGTGISGTVTIGTTQTLSVGGFAAKKPSGSLTFEGGQVTDGSIKATLTIPKTGDVGISITVMSDGRFTVGVQPNQSLELDGLGVEAKLTTARLQINPNTGAGTLFVTGKLKFDQGKLPALKGAEVGITDLGFDSQGNVYLPSDGKLDLKEPLIIDLKAVKITGREVGFEGVSGQVNAIQVTGGVQFPAEIPITGGVNFKGLKIEKGSPNPKVTIEGIDIDARMQGIGSIKGTIAQRQAPPNAPTTDLGSYFFGSAVVNLDALQGAGLGLTLLISDKKAWFLGGSARIPTPLLITPTEPILGIYGFSGGFGYNVAKRPGFSGRVTQPEELVFNSRGALVQAGVLLGDSAGGAAWWGEINLTGSFTGPAIDEIELAGRVTFLNDPTKNLPRFVARTSEWDEMDRTGYMVLSLEPRKPRFTATAGIDFYLPTRDVSLIELSGQSQLKFAPSERTFYIALGWNDTPSNLKPLSVELAKVASKNIKITARGGILLDFTSSMGTNLSERKITGKAFLDAYAKGDLGPVDAGVSLVGKVNAVMVYERNGKAVFPEFLGDGRVSVDGWIRVPVLGKASAGGSLAADLKRTKLVLDGNVYAYFDTFLGRKKIDRDITLELKK